jgi:phosphotriesterase-related protein
MESISTVLGSILPSQLGYCQIHEHVLVKDTPAAKRYPQLRMDRPDASLAELRIYQQTGGRSLVDAQPVGAGRNILGLAELSRQSQVNIVAATGFHRPMFYGPDHWIHEATVADLAALFVEELERGAYADGETNWPQEQTSIQAGLVKAAIGTEGLDLWSLRLLTAAGQAAVATGSALMLHTEAGQHAVEAIRLLSGLGLPASRIIVCHVDRQAENLAPHLNIAKTGVYLDYDTIGRFKYHSDEAEIWLIQLMIAAGHLGQLMLALDTTAERFRSYGGSIGLDYLLKQFLPAMRNQGISSRSCNQMLIHNPAKILSRQVKFCQMFQYRIAVNA